MPAFYGVPCIDPTCALIAHNYSSTCPLRDCGVGACHVPPYCRLGLSPCYVRPVWEVSMLRLSPSGHCPCCGQLSIPRLLSLSGSFVSERALFQWFCMELGWCRFATCRSLLYLPFWMGCPCCNSPASSSQSHVSLPLI
jgi:hypothetical protein